MCRAATITYKDYVKLHTNLSIIFNQLKVIKPSFKFREGLIILSDTTTIKFRNPFRSLNTNFITSVGKQNCTQTFLQAWNKICSHYDNTYQEPSEFYNAFYQISTMNLDLNITDNLLHIGRMQMGVNLNKWLYLYIPMDMRTRVLDEPLSSYSSYEELELALEKLFNNYPAVLYHLLTNCREQLYSFLGGFKNER